MTSEESGESPQRIGSTNAEYGQGRPRLIFVVGSDNWNGSDPAEFALRDPSTRIGSGLDMDLRLEGLNPFHAEIRHDEHDEYVLFLYGPAEVGSDLKTPTENTPAEAGRILRTGARVQLGEWAMSYYREEFADHGRPFGGREGGELERQPDQSGQPLDQIDG